jgi:benzoyl-CoA reductase/2-hydroxyglutaryl-CoA dehydratase subunit BcrC/BadD/HgdB
VNTHWMKTLSKYSDQNLLDIENAKKNGRKVVGFYCLYSPMELAVAADAICLPLCGTRNDPISAAETVLPRNLCPLIKSSFGFAMTDSCPFFRFSDLIVADTTCDGKKKMFEILTQYKPLHILQLPQTQESEKALPIWHAEIVAYKKALEKHLEVSIGDEEIHAAIILLNQERMARKALMDLGRENPAPISGMNLIEIMFKIGFLADKRKGIALMQEVVQDISQNPQKQSKQKGPRLLLTGVPVGLGSHKVVQIAEQAGALVVAFENCSGYKQTFLVEEQGDPLMALAKQYLATPCSVMSPNSGRLDLLDEMIPGFAIDGVIDLTWQACHTYNVESYRVQKFVQEKFGLPFLHLESDYSEADTEQLRVRIEAFLEMLP